MEQPRPDDRSPTQPVGRRPAAGAMPPAAWGDAGSDHGGTTSRRTTFKRVAAGVGALVAVGADAAVADADRPDTGRPLFVRVLGGAGPLAAFLPGIGATSRYWEWVVGPLAARSPPALDCS